MNKNILYIGNLLSKYGYTPGTVETLGPLLENEGYRIIYAGTFHNKLLRIFEMLYSIFKNRNKLEYILIDTYSTNAFWYAYLSGRMSNMLKLKYIPVLHGGNLPWRLKKSKKSCDFLFNKSYQNVAVSGYLHDAFKLAGYKSIIISNNIEIAKYSFKVRRLLNPNLLWVRSFQNEYNPLLAVEVLSLIVENYPNAKLCMVGPDKDGSMQKVEKIASDLNLSKNLLITGRLSKSEWHKLSEEYDIFINTTNFDNTPVSVIEAAALGFPIISTNVGGIPYLLENNENAILLNPGDKVLFSSAVKKLLDDPIIAEKLSINARLMAERYDWSNIKRSWIELLD